MRAHKPSYQGTRMGPKSIMTVDKVHGKKCLGSKYLDGNFLPKKGVIIQQLLWLQTSKLYW